MVEVNGTCYNWYFMLAFGNLRVSLIKRYQQYFLLSQSFYGTDILRGGKCDTKHLYRQIVKQGRKRKTHIQDLHVINTFLPWRHLKIPQDFPGK